MNFAPSGAQTFTSQADASQLRDLRSNIGSKLVQHFNKDQSQHDDQDVAMSQHFSAQLRTMRSDPSGRFSPGSEKNLISVFLFPISKQRWPSFVLCRRI